MARKASELLTYVTYAEADGPFKIEKIWISNDGRVWNAIRWTENSDTLAVL